MLSFLPLFYQAGIIETLVAFIVIHHIQHATQGVGTRFTRRWWQTLRDDFATLIEQQFHGPRHDQRSCGCCCCLVSDLTTFVIQLRVWLIAGQTLQFDLATDIAARDCLRAECGTRGQRCCWTCRRWTLCLQLSHLIGGHTGERRQRGGTWRTRRRIHLQWRRFP